MTQAFQRTEGIILRVIPFGDYDQILSIFTQDAGLIKVLFKGSRSPRKGVQGICIPLTGVEVVYREKNSEIFACQEMDLVESYYSLRRNLLHLEIACDLLQAVGASQLVGKAAPHLYALLQIYLGKIPCTPDPRMLAVSFRLKVLLHEGLIAFPFVCCACDQIMQGGGGYHIDSEWWCAHHHQVSGGRLWSQEELELLYRLGSSRSYREIALLGVSARLYDGVVSFFDASMKK